MSYDSEIYEVPWDSDRWELALLERPDILFFGQRGSWVLYRPERVVVRERALGDQRIRDLVERGGADRCDEPEAEVARALDMALLLAPRDRQLELVRRINEVEPGSASLDHVQLPGPHRVHGDDKPLPAPDPGDIPGDGLGGEDMKVLLLDTGCDSTLAKSLNVDMQPTDEEVVDEDHDGLRDPAAGHGTHMAGIISRLAPQAQIVSRRLLKSPVGEASDLDVANALLNHGNADLINCSFGEMTYQNQPPIIIRDALAALPSTTVVVGAAGNAGVSQFDWPSAFERVIAVGAVVKPAGSSTWLQTDFSNHGPWVDCCAPGVGIVSTFLTVEEEHFEGYASWTGTSMACPIVLGTIAALATASGKGKAGLADAVTQVLALPKIGTVGAFVNPATLL